jgi:hypothetical protein
MILAAISVEWAGAVNTALLIILAIVNGVNARRTRRRVDLVSQQAADAKNKCGANRRDEDAAFMEDVKHHVPDIAVKRRRGRRFYDPDE